MKQITLFFLIPLFIDVPLHAAKLNYKDIPFPLSIENAVQLAKDYISTMDAYNNEHKQILEPLLARESKNRAAQAAAEQKLKELKTVCASKTPPSAAFTCADQAEKSLKSVFESITTETATIEQLKSDYARLFATHALSADLFKIYLAESVVATFQMENTEHEVCGKPEIEVQDKQILRDSQEYSEMGGDAELNQRLADVEPATLRLAKSFEAREGGSNQHPYFYVHRFLRYLPTQTTECRSDNDTLVEDRTIFHYEISDCINSYSGSTASCSSPSDLYSAVRNGDLPKLKAMIEPYRKTAGQHQKVLKLN